VNWSDTIVVGLIKRVQPYVSEDKRNIYTRAPTGDLLDRHILSKPGEPIRKSPELASFGDAQLNLDTCTQQLHVVTPRACWSAGTQ
jgi:hypothetical protein